jgi:hypothetical protein
VFRYKQIVVKKCHRYTQIWLNTQTTMKNAINPQVTVNSALRGRMRGSVIDSQHKVSAFHGFKVSAFPAFTVQELVGEV